MVLPVTPRKARHYKTKEHFSPFDRWIKSLSDIRAQAKITKAITQMEGGNFGDHKSVGNGLYERRLDYGPGYRIYYITEGDELIIIFAGSEKKDQQGQIDASKGYLEDYNKRKSKELVSDKSKASKKRKPPVRTRNKTRKK